MPSDGLLSVGIRELSGDYVGHKIVHKRAVISQFTEFKRETRT